MAIRIHAEGLRQVFSRRTIFSGISFSVSGAGVLLIAGRNGSGKSTLVKILCGVLTPTAGWARIESDGAQDQFGRKAMIGLVAPYLQLYEEFSAMENLRMSMNLRGYRPSDDVSRGLLDRVALDAQRQDPVRGFSSGMKQRLKYAMALVHRPSILVLDEPMSNLDADGTAIVRSIMHEQRTAGILVVATNDLTDIDGWDTEVNLNAAR
ncbi:MAG: ABC transporter ATP-binding protein [Bacteroidetes bacterium]|nr:ABC transporter ATP-binding protein [Bacteroidota bacterium]